jgi:hypothetical protein
MSWIISNPFHACFTLSPDHTTLTSYSIAQRSVQLGFLSNASWIRGVPSMLFAIDLNTRRAPRADAGHVGTRCEKETSADRLHPSGAPSEYSKQRRENPQCERRWRRNCRNDGGTYARIMSSSLMRWRVCLASVLESASPAAAIEPRGSMSTPSDRSSNISLDCVISSPVPTSS